MKHAGFRWRLARHPYRILNPAGYDVKCNTDLSARSVWERNPKRPRQRAPSYRSKDCIGDGDGDNSFASTLNAIEQRFTTVVSGRNILWIDSCWCLGTRRFFPQMHRMHLWRQSTAHQIPLLELEFFELRTEDELIQEFITQAHFKYVRALGSFYLR